MKDNLPNPSNAHRIRALEKDSKRETRDSDSIAIPSDVLRPAQVIGPVDKGDDEDSETLIEVVWLDVREVSGEMEYTERSATAQAQVAVLEGALPEPDTRGVCAKIKGRWVWVSNADSDGTVFLFFTLTGDMASNVAPANLTTLDGSVIAAGEVKDPHDLYENLKSGAKGIAVLIEGIAGIFIIEANQENLFEVEVTAATPSSGSNNTVVTATLVETPAVSISWNQQYPIDIEVGRKLWVQRQDDDTWDVVSGLETHFRFTLAEDVGETTEKQADANLKFINTNTYDGPTVIVRDPANIFRRLRNEAQGLCIIDRKTGELFIVAANHDNLYEAEIVTSAIASPVDATAKLIVDDDIIVDLELQYHSQVGRRIWVQQTAQTTDVWKVVSGLETHFKFTLTQDIISSVANADLEFMSGSMPTVRNYPVKDSFGIFASLKSGDRGICIRDKDDFYIIESDNIGKKLGKTDSTINPGGTGTVSIWSGSPIVDTGVNVMAALLWMHGGESVSSGKEVIIEWYPGLAKWLIVGAECED